MLVTRIWNGKRFMIPLETTLLLKPMHPEISISLENQTLVVARSDYVDDSAERNWLIKINSLVPTKLKDRDGEAMAKLLTKSVVWCKWDLPVISRLSTSHNNQWLMSAFHTYLRELFMHKEATVKRLFYNRIELCCLKTQEIRRSKW